MGQLALWGCDVSPVSTDPRQVWAFDTILGRHLHIDKRIVVAQIPSNYPACVGSCRADLRQQHASLAMLNRPEPAVRCPCSIYISSATAPAVPASAAARHRRPRGGSSAPPQTGAAAVRGVKHVKHAAAAVDMRCQERRPPSALHAQLQNHVTVLTANPQMQ